MWGDPGDPHPMHTVFMYLLTNAKKAVIVGSTKTKEAIVADNTKSAQAFEKALCEKWAPTVEGRMVESTPVTVVYVNIDMIL